ncbi:MAG: 7-carboxy-7-deazaguanine synthase QueE [Thermoleophilia bacterium]|nr:7-carboxy-7-deazaguanine synthase QueE [Thermoleophilia bacterium]
MFRINEVFRSIQGEGPAIGQPATFIRFSGCNLSCVYCDTDHASCRPWRLEELLDEAARGPSRVIITGGEPLLAGEALVPLAAGLAGTGRKIDIETNGTISPPPDLPGFVDNFVVSPKLSNSENNPASRRLAAGLPPGFFKFVADDVADLDEAGLLAQEHPGRDIIVMPMATDPKAVIEKMKILREPVEARGWRLLPRLHVLLGLR